MLCPGKKRLYPHLPQATKPNTPLVAAANPTPSPDAVSMSSTEGDGATQLKQAKVDFSGRQQVVSRAELNTLIARCVFENITIYLLYILFLFMWSAAIC